MRAEAVRQVVAQRLSDLPRYSQIRWYRTAALLDDVVNPHHVHLVYAEGGNAPDMMQAILEAQGRQRTVASKIMVKPELLEVMRQQSMVTAQRAVAGEEMTEAQRQLDEILREAFLRKASDIHITVGRHMASIRYRMHGELFHIRDIPRDRAIAICSAGYNTLAESTSVKEGFNPAKPLDGLIEREHVEGVVRYRFSSLPIAPDGFDVTLRVIPIGVDVGQRSLSALGYEPGQIEHLERMFAYAQGMIIVGGATNSGKSTTIGTMLRKMAVEKPHKKFRTIEEPVEFLIPNVAQTPVTRVRDDGSDFLVALRHMMRSDPDVIMIGEIRDLETARLAIQAVQTGHLCITTIHTSNIMQTYQRLIAMGISAQDLAIHGLIVGLVNQTLLPRMCEACAVEEGDYLKLNANVMQKARGLVERTHRVLGDEVARRVRYRNPLGCERCHHHGVVDRTVAAEILRPNREDILHAVRETRFDEMVRIWRAEIGSREEWLLRGEVRGRTAFEHGLSKMARGIVDPSAVEDMFHRLDEPSWIGGDVDGL